MLQMLACVLALSLSHCKQILCCLKGRSCSVFTKEYLQRVHIPPLPYQQDELFSPNDKGMCSQCHYYIAA